MIISLSFYVEGSLYFSSLLANEGVESHSNEKNSLHVEQIQDGYSAGSAIFPLTYGDPSAD